MGELNITGQPEALSGLGVPDRFRPIHLRYLSYDNQTNDFKLPLDKGDPIILNTSTDLITQDLLKYFFVGLALPNNSF
ncbi:MAG: hypothetical protein NC908_04690 [Candidatus Omnitrophica bacterium]|nr:hypothetical protein [Candidatus Omnitrophota bacterium]